MQYLDTERTGMYRTLMEYLGALEIHGIRGEIIPTTEKAWLTPAGGLRKEGWTLRLSPLTSEPEKNITAALYNYIQKLNERYRDRGPGMFNKVNLSVLIN